jgi:hypothetical protein
VGWQDARLGDGPDAELPGQAFVDEVAHPHPLAEGERDRPRPSRETPDRVPPEQIDREPPGRRVQGQRLQRPLLLDASDKAAGKLGHERVGHADPVRKADLHRVAGDKVGGRVGQELRRKEELHGSTARAPAALALLPGGHHGDRAGAGLAGIAPVLQPPLDAAGSGKMDDQEVILERGRPVLGGWRPVVGEAERAALGQAAQPRTARHRGDPIFPAQHGTGHRRCPAASGCAGIINATPLAQPVERSTMISHVRGGGQSRPLCVCRNARQGH